MELIDIWNINRYICKVLHQARIITRFNLLWKFSPWVWLKFCFLTIIQMFLTVKADFRVTAETRFYSWIYTLQSRDLDTQKAFETSGANDKLINLIYNGVKSPFQKIIYRLDILFKQNAIIINLTWYDCNISSRRSIIFHKKGPGKGVGGVEGEGKVTKGGRGAVRLRWKFWTMSCLYSNYIYKCINITIKQMYRLYI